jgi:excinuclease UvrABC helicase subunit UvrB
VLEIMPSYAESAYRIPLFGEEIEGINTSTRSRAILDTIDHVSVWPASHDAPRRDAAARGQNPPRTELAHG